MGIRRRSPWLLALAIATAGLAVLLMAPSVAYGDRLDDETRAIAKELRCPVCAGETVADSNAQLSVQMRGIIRQKLEAGESRDAILSYFVASYGEQVLASPPPRGFTLGVWLAPIAVLLLGLAVVYAVLRGWLRGRADQLVTAGPPSRGLSRADNDRLERELARFRRETASE